MDEGRHRPGPGRWDAAWLLWPQRFLLGHASSGLATHHVVMGVEGDYTEARWLTAPGWSAVMGLPEFR